jgi:hypothetical protein
LDDNLREVGQFINRGQNAGVGTEAYGELITELVAFPELTSYRGALSQLSPEFYGEHQAQLISSSMRFAGRLMSCKQAGGEHRFTREGSCVWGVLAHHDHDLNADGEYKDIDGTTNEVAFGMQKTLENDWSFGFGLSAERPKFDGYGNRWSADGHTYHMGVSAKRRIGPSKFTGVLSYSMNEMDVTRRGDLLGGFVSDAERDLDVLAATLRWSHDLEWDTRYLRPTFDVGILQLHGDRTREHGANGASLVLDSFKETHTWARAALAAGKEFKSGNDNVWRFNAILGRLAYLDDDTTQTRARFAGAVPGVSAMSVPIDLGEPAYDGTLGVEFITKKDSAIGLFYQRQWSDDRSTDAVVLKASYAF